jgi:hypothetical protein
MTGPNASSDHPASDPPGGEAAADAPMLLQVSKREWTRVLVGCVVGLHLLNIPAVLFRYVWPLPGSSYYVEFFAVSGEGKLPTFYSGLTLLAVAALLGLVWVHERRRHGPFRWHWAALAVIFVALAMDEMLALHEVASDFIRSRLHIEEGWFYNAWVIPAGVALGLVALVFFRFLVHLPARTRVLFLLAGAVYVSGAVVLEMAGGAYASVNSYDLAYGVLASVEEVLEMAGIVVMLYAIMDHLERHAPQTLLRVVD